MAAWSEALRNIIRQIIIPRWMGSPSGRSPFIADLRHSIVTKLLMVIFSAYLIVTISVTAAQMYIEYKHAARSVHIGNTTIIPSHEDIINSVKQSFLIIIINAIIKTLALWLIFLWAGRRYISLPLEVLQRATLQVAAGHLEQVPVEADDQSELAVLARHFNMMVAKVGAATSLLSNAKQHLAHMIDVMPSALVGINRAGLITDWNIQAEKLGLLPYAKAIGRNYTDVLPFLSLYTATVERAISDNATKFVSQAPLFLGNERRFFDIVIYPLKTVLMEGAVILIEEVTRQYEMQEVVVQTEKMSTVGRLAAGMAHEINNPLGAITQNAQNLQRRLTKDLPKNLEVAARCNLSMDALEKYLEERGINIFIQAILESGERAAKIVANLLRFSRRSDLILAPVNIIEIIDKAIELVATDYVVKAQLRGKTVIIEREYAPDLPEVRGEPTELQLVIINIVKNATQAMLDAEAELDALTLESENRPTNTIKIHAFVKEPYLRIEIADNGPGMQEEVRRRIFEPFYTTKSVGQGTGLGLSVCYHIITESHHGRIFVESALGQGTTFVIELPL